MLYQCKWHGIYISDNPEVKKKMTKTDDAKRKISEGLKKYNNDKVKLKEKEGPE